MHKLWLGLVQYYPTLAQQQASGLSLQLLNEKLVDLFHQKWQRLLPESASMLVELTEEYLLAQLLPLS